MASWLEQLLSTGATRDPQHDGVSVSFSSTRISSRELKAYLDRIYPEQYSVQLKRDRFTVTIGKDRGKTESQPEHPKPEGGES
ncbi:hypothetical protein F4677DRAFT_412177 [Hypoxylon crocopeplum]|nr:hypothetical protein F4677DRAFT_412177 [Hypoxylon crocopeplum]